MKSTGQHLPTSLLDGLILCSQFWLRPLLPTLSAPCVAADAEFAGLLFLENALKSSGVFFLKRNGNVGKGRIDPSLQESLASVSSSDRFLYKPQKPRQTAPSPSHRVCSCLDGCRASDFHFCPSLASCALLSAVSRDALKWAVCVFCGQLHAFGVTLRLLMVDFLQNTVVLRPAERLSCRRDITGLSLVGALGMQGTLRWWRLALLWARPRSLPQGVLVIYFGSAASWRPCNVVRPHQGLVSHS